MFTGAYLGQLLVLSAFGFALILIGAVSGAAFARVRNGRPIPEVPLGIGLAHELYAHQAQAVHIAALAQDRSGNRHVHRHAYGVASEHAARVGRIAGWLELGGQPVQPDGTPEMVAEDDLTRLRALSGPSFDLLFLQLLLQHHEDGLGLVDEVLERVDSGPVRDLVGTIAASYQVETKTLRTMITERASATRRPRHRSPVIPRGRRW